MILILKDEIRTRARRINKVVFDIAEANDVSIETVKRWVYSKDPAKQRKLALKHNQDIIRKHLDIPADTDITISIN
ncbi:hypothetical protein [Polluticaenibacter yanchengensis]|uniref:Transposase n=1 Tax=Polluticaenibacter yanchengensis TaxID=3014562 RepID=A0ABT4UIL6_9BACT|nr:hypothetical protein [Chitinophagaceae bacterium LY-5]